MSAAETLVEFAKSPDPFRGAPPGLADLQLEAVRERFAERRQQIRTLDKRARETGVDAIRSFEDVVPLLFAHTNYKSYPEAFIDSGQWTHMNHWLRTLSTHPTDRIAVEGLRDVDEWIARSHAAGHFLFASSGTSGKSSFLNQTAKDREYAVAACLHAFTFSSPDFVPDRSRIVFTQMPSKGTHKMIEVASAQFERWAKPGELHRAIEEPMLAMDTMRPAQLRRLLAIGKVKPAEIAAYEAETAARQARRAAAFDAWLDKLYEKHREPLYLGLMWGAAWSIVERLRARGVRDADFHPATLMSIGGGTKGAKLPADYQAQITGFFGVTPDRITASYSMVEMSGFCAKVPPTESYAVPPWIVPLVLDKAGEKLLNPAGGRGTAEGRMAFFDILADGRWGGIISGDKVRMEFGSGLGGVRVPVVREINRYADLEEGEDKLSCAGSIDAYVRGSIAA
ncbi:MAG: hypothetical protein ABSG29_09115 [Steroidobacteraceae bacterium]